MGSEHCLEEHQRNNSISTTHVIVSSSFTNASENLNEFINWSIYAGMHYISLMNEPQGGAY